MGFKFVPDKNQPYRIFSLGATFAPEGVIVGNLRDGDPQLTPHFKAHEFACPDCKVYKIAIRTLEGLENVRVRAGVPLEVAKTTLTSVVNSGGSGYRCWRHNAETPHSSSHSKHMMGYAVDVHPTGTLTVAELYKLMDSEPVFHGGGLGLYKDFVHGDSWAKRRWQG